MPDIASKEKPHAASRDEERREATLPAMRVRYYRQMKPQRVYTVDVGWQKSAKPARGEVTVRLIVAGAQVLPSEQKMDASQPNVRAVFYVTPLAKGWLRNQKLEVLSQGRKVQEIPMASKVVGQRFTWFLLLCTFFVPWFLTEFIKMSPMAETSRRKDDRIVFRYVDKEVESYIKDNVPAMPAELKGTVVETWLLEGRSAVAKGYQKLVEISRVVPIAFYTGAVLLALTLISAYLHKAKRRQAYGKPLQIAAAS
jgi:hypothetical protein